MYYGSAKAPDQSNKTGVWDSNYKGVWHLLDGGTTTRTDSTSNGRDGTPQHYTATTETIGLIGKADKIWELGLTAATSQYVSFDATASTAMNCATGESLTVSIWTKVTTFDAVYQAIFAKGNTAWRLSRDNTNPNEAFCYNYNGATTSHYNPVVRNCVDGNWHYLVGTYNTVSGSFTTYVDGTWEVTSSEAVAGQSLTNSNTVDIGFNSGSTARGFSGVIDEARLSKVDRGRSWIRTEYKNQSAPAGFCSFAAEVQRPSVTLIGRHDIERRRWAEYIRGE